MWDENLFVGGYWGRRRESAEECAKRLVRFFSDLKRCDKALVDWHETARSKAEALRRKATPCRYEYWLTKLARSRVDGNKPIAESRLGFGFVLWNGKDGDLAVGLHIGCGIDSRNVGNCVFFELAAPNGQWRHDAMKAVLVALAQAWDPDWATVASERAKNRRRFMPTRPFVDWMLYVSDRHLRKEPILEPPATIEHLESGTLIVVQKTMPDPANVAHVENVRRVRNALRNRIVIAPVAAIRGNTQTQSRQGATSPPRRT